VVHHTNRDSVGCRVRASLRARRKWRYANRYSRGDESRHINSFVREHDNANQKSSFANSVADRRADDRAADRALGGVERYARIYAADRRISAGTTRYTSAY